MQVLALVGFGFGFSPLIADLALHWWSHSWARYSLLFGPLLWVAVRSDARRSSPSRAGWLTLGVALALELMAVAAGYTRMARPALPLGLFGLCRALGLASWPVALLGFWLVPVPNALLGSLSPELESVWLALAGWLPSALGVPVSVNGATLSLPDVVVTLSGRDSGLLLACLLSGLGWYRGLRAGLGPAACAAWAAGLGAAAFVLQGLALVGWVGLATLGVPLPDVGWLTPGLAVVASAALLLGPGSATIDRHAPQPGEGRL